MMMDLKSRRLIGSMAKAKIMYYSFLFVVFLNLGISDRFTCLGKAGSWVRSAPLQRSRRGVGSDVDV